MERKKRVISPEIKAKLMGCVPISKKIGVPFTPDFFNDTPKDLRPIYFQRGWTVQEKIDFSSIGEDEAKAQELIRVTVVGGDNMIDFGSDEEIEFELEGDGGMSKELYDTLPSKTTTALMINAIKISGLKKEEKEGLESEPLSKPE